MSPIKKPSSDSSISDPSAAESLNMLLDYAIAEGVELNLPVFVVLLRMASLELAKSVRGEGHPNPSSRSRSDAEERTAP